MHEIFRNLPRSIKALFFCIGLVLFLSLGLFFFLVWRSNSLHAAARRGDMQDIEEILDRHPQWIENRNRLGVTPLQEAALEGQVAALEVLIRRGANLHAGWEPATGEAQWTALHICGIQGRVKEAEVLLRAGADVNARSLKGYTPLDIAIENQHTELAALLRLRGGASGADLAQAP